MANTLQSSTASLFDRRNQAIFTPYEAMIFFVKSDISPRIRFTQSWDLRKVGYFSGLLMFFRLAASNRLAMELLVSSASPSFALLSVEGF